MGEEIQAGDKVIFIDGGFTIAGGEDVPDYTIINHGGFLSHGSTILNRDLYPKNKALVRYVHSENGNTTYMVEYDDEDCQRVCIGFKRKSLKKCFTTWKERISTPE